MSDVVEAGDGGPASNLPSVGSANLLTRGGNHLAVVPSIGLAFLGCVAAGALLATLGKSDTVKVHDALDVRLALAALTVLALGSAKWLSRLAQRPRADTAASPGRWSVFWRTACRGLLHSYRAVAGTKGAPPGPHRSGAQKPTPDLIHSWIEEFYNRYTDVELSRTARAVLLPRRYVHRAVQAVTLNDLSTTQTVSREIRVPGEYNTAKKTRVVVPVLTLRKEELVDALDVECEGNTASTLGYRESQGASLWLAAMILKRAAVKDEDFFKALTCIGSEHTEKPPSLPLNEPTLAAETREAQELVDLLATHRLIFVEVSAAPGARVSLKVQWVNRDHDRFRTIPDRARMTIGLGPTSISGGVVGAEAASWHLRVHAPPGSHMRRAVLYLPTGVDPNAFVTSHNRVHGKDLAHVRVRRVSNKMPSHFRVYLGETPPGIGGPLALLATALAATLWLVGFYFNRAFPDVVKGVNDQAAGETPQQLGKTARAVVGHPGGVTAAVMLTAISVVSAWLISRFSEDAVRRAQFREVLALFAIMLTSFGAVFSAALRVAGFRVFGPVAQPVFDSRIEVENRFWFMMMLISAGIFLMAWGSLLLRVRRLNPALAPHNAPEWANALARTGARAGGTKTKSHEATRELPGVIFQRATAGGMPYAGDSSPRMFELPSLQPQDIGEFDFTCGGWVQRSTPTLDGVEKSADDATGRARNKCWPS